MNIFQGTILSNADTGKSGKLLVLMTKTNEQIDVTYTSPYFSTYGTGFFAIPEIGQKILIVLDDDTGEYFYVSTILSKTSAVGADSVSKANERPDLFVAERKAYTPSGMPGSMFFKNQKGAGLKITNYYAKNEPIVNNVELKSAQGNRLVLGDSPDSNGINLLNSHGDGVTITGSKNSAFGGQTIQIKSLNSHRCVVQHGEYSVTVNNGRDITIRNNSIGTHSYYFPNPLDPALQSNPLLQFGNINLVSKWRDINIYTDNPAFLPPGFPSNIYISTNKGLIQLKATGDVNVYSNLGKVTVQGNLGLDLIATTGDINLHAVAGNVNIKSNLNVNIAATSNLNAEGLTSTNLGSGSPLHLNKTTGAGAFLATAQMPIPTPELLQEKNVYGK